MKIRHLALFSVLVPVAALVSGCGGGNNGPKPPTTNPPTTNPPGSGPLPPGTVPEPGAPTFPTITVPKTFLRLPSGQIAALELTRNGGSSQGTLRVFNGTNSDSSLNAGLYQVFGSFSGPSAFSVQTSSTDPDKFTLSGTVPQDGRGTFNFKKGKFEGSGVLLPPGENFIFPSSRPTGVGNLQFSNFFLPSFVPPEAIAISEAPVAVTPTGPNAFTRFDPMGLLATATVLRYTISANNTLTSEIEFSQARRDRLSPTQPGLSISIIPPLRNSDQGATSSFLNVGQSFDLSLAASTPNVTPRVQFIYGGIYYLGRSGTMTIQSLGAESIVVELKNVNVYASNRFPSRFDVNGTFEDSGTFSRIIAEP